MKNINHEAYLWFWHSIRSFIHSSFIYSLKYVPVNSVVILWERKSEENYVGLKIYNIYDNIWERKSEENYVGLKIKIELSTKYGRAIYESYKSALTNIILFFKDLLKKTFHVIVPKKTSTNQLPSKDSVSMSSVYSRFLSQNCGFFVSKDC